MPCDSTSILKVLPGKIDIKRQDTTPLKIHLPDFRRLLLDDETRKSVSVLSHDRLSSIATQTPLTTICISSSSGMSTLKLRSHKQQGVIRRNLKNTF